MYFKISISDDMPSEEINPNTLNIEISGTDAQAYSVIQPLTFQIQNVYNEIEPELTECTAINISQTSARIVATASQDGIVYWFVGGRGRTVPTISQFIEEFSETFYQQSEVQAEPQFRPEEVEPAQVDIENTLEQSPWKHYARRKYEQFLLKFYKGASSVKANQQTELVSFNNLYSETKLKVACYFVNNFGTSTELISTNWSTLDMDEAVQISLNIQIDVSQTQIPNLTKQIAQLLGISTFRFLQHIFRNANLTYKDSISTINWLIPPDRSISDYSPSDICTLTSNQKQQLNEIIYGLYPDLKYNPTFTFTPIFRGSYGKPEWAKKPSLKSSPTTHTVTASMACDVQGEMCGVCITPPSDDIIVDNNTILYGFDQHYKVVPGVCVPNDGVNVEDVIIEGLLHSADYRCFYLCFDDYPIWPGYMVYNKDLPIAYVDARTPTVDFDPDELFASNIVLDFIALVLVIL